MSSPRSSSGSGTITSPSRPTTMTTTTRKRRSAGSTVVPTTTAATTTSAIPTPTTTMTMMETPQSRVHRWIAVQDRWKTARSYFDFETLEFTAIRKTTKKTNHKTSAASKEEDWEDDDDGKKSNQATVETAESSGSSSGHFSQHLSLTPSQQLLRHSSAASMSSSTKSINTSFRNNQSSSTRRRSNFQQEMNLDRLATQDVRVVGRDEEIRTLQILYENAVSSTTSSAAADATTTKTVTSSYKDHNNNNSSSNNNSKKKMVVVVGPSGSGKSVLALQLKSRITTTSGSHSRGGSIWCAGKFDQRNQADPYEAIAQALSSLIQNTAQSNPLLLEQWKRTVSQTLGDDVTILMELVPIVSVFCQPDSTNSSKEQQSVLDDAVVPSSRSSSDRSITEKAIRIQNVLVEFLRLVATEESPVILLLDDIQWASSSALALMDALLVNPNLHHFFLVTTCRQEYLLPTDDAIATDSDDNVAATHLPGGKKCGGLVTMTPLQQLLQRHSDQLHQIVIGGLTVDGVQQLINTLLRMDVHEPQTLALAEIVHHKCDGNPFFVLQFMNLLCKQNLLTYDWGSFTWNWIEGDIQSQNVATNVADAVQKRLKTLSSQEQLILQVASCIGVSFERPMIEFVLRGLQSQYQNEWDDFCSDWPQGELDHNLETLHDLGIIEKQFVNERYEFSHDQVQAAAFGLIPDSRKVQMQTAIGQVLITGLDENHRDHFLFTAVKLWGIGEPNMTEAEKKHYAFWAFLAGDTALKQGAFDAALNFFSTAIDCLGDCPFQKDPKMALPLFSGAAEASYCMNDKRVLDYVNTVKQQSTVSKSDTMRVAIIELKVLSNNRDFAGCVDAFRKLCKDLGAAKFSKKPGIPSLLYQVVRTTRLLKKYDRDKFLQLPVCTDPNIIGALRAENTCFAQLYMSNPNLCVVATCQAVQWSIQHGHSKDTAPALVSMAMMIIGISGDYNLAYEVGEIALELCNVYRYKETLPATVALVFGYVRHWVKPLHDFVAPMRYAMDLGMRVGNLDVCGLVFSTHGLMLLLCQIDTLTSAIHEIEGYRRIMIEHNIKDHLVFTQCNLQFAHKMAFENDDCWSLNGDIMNEDDMFAVAAQNKDLILAAFIHYQKIMLNVYFDRPVDAAKFATKNVDVGFKICQGCHFVPRNTFFVGLSMILAHRVDGKASRLRIANLVKKRLKAWLKAGNPNVLHFLHLLQAELNYTRHKFADAQDEYITAIKVSMRTGFKLDFALSNERLSLFYADAANPLEDPSRSRYHMEAAIESYAGYGAANKVRYMQQKHTDILLQ